MKDFSTEELCLAACWDNSYRKGPFEGVGGSVFASQVTARMNPAQSPVGGVFKYRKGEERCRVLASVSCFIS